MSPLHFILLFGFFSACGVVSKEANMGDNLKKVAIHATVHKPYCGGAKPSPDVAAGYYESMKFEKFKLFKGENFSSGMQELQDVDLDEGGNITLMLAPGSYFLMRADKLLTLDEFISMNGPFEEKNFEMMDKSCFQNWKNTPDLVFKVVNDTLIEHRVKGKCWVGTNPCLKYTGPPAP